jgi:hypothetical protein
MTIELASSAMQALALVFMTMCVALKALKIVETDALLVGVAMGSVLICCSSILVNNIYIACAMFTAHVVGAALVVIVNREAPYRTLARLHWRKHDR